MRLETPGGRGYSTQFVDHEGLLHNFAKKGFARLQAARVNWVDYEEVYGQMQLYYTQAHAKFNPALGWTFAAYLGRVCANNFNKWARLLIQEQMGLGTVNIEDLNNDDGQDFYEVLAGEDESPEDIIERLDYIQKTRASLSPDAKSVLRNLVKPSEAIADAMQGRTRSVTVALICRVLEFTPMQAQRVRDEITRAFGIKV